MATDDIPGTGYSILYAYGIFKQKIVDGWQQERADNWLPGGGVGLKSHPDQAVEVRFDGEIEESWDGVYHHVAVSYTHLDVYKRQVQHNGVEHRADLFYKHAQRCRQDMSAGCLLYTSRCV